MCSAQRGDRAWNRAKIFKNGKRELQINLVAAESYLMEGKIMMLEADFFKRSYRH